MSLSEAPLFTDVEPAPLPGAAYWAHTSDGLRIRLGVWQPADARGTVLLFPGRTEYIEKYGPAVGEIAARGYASIVIDWRGQGLADRMLDDANIGHVHRFRDYQRDIAAMVDAARSLNLPKPFFLLAHSMGGCIGLRALYEGLPVVAAAFSGPMWGIKMAPHLRPVAWTLGRIIPALGQGHLRAPGTEKVPYVLGAPFKDNTLTTDSDMFDMMQKQLRAHPGLSLGGPSIVWLREALDETLALDRRQAPKMPCRTYLGTNERIVHTGRIHDRMATWENGALHLIDGGEHEIMMETPKKRVAFFDDMTAFFDKNCAQ